jgi:ketosteroid isomerase-like protein
MSISPNASTAPEAFGSTLPSGEARRNLETARQYLAAIEEGGEEHRALAFLAPDVVQIEYPNQFVPTGAERDLQGLKEAAVRGARVLQSQRYEVRTAIANGSDVALEVRWVGVLAIPAGALAVGDEMRAHFGVFLTFRDGLIIHQRNYDCFDPF